MSASSQKKKKNFVNDFLPPLSLSFSSSFFLRSLSLLSPLSRCLLSPSLSATTPSIAITPFSHRFRHRRQLVCPCYSNLNIYLLCISFPLIQPSFRPPPFSDYKNRWLCKPTLSRSTLHCDQRKCVDRRGRERGEGVERRSWTSMVVVAIEGRRGGSEQGRRKNEEMEKEEERGMTKMYLV